MIRSNVNDDERGSATAEFVLVALPLFLPALLFFLSMHQSAVARESGSMMAREAAEAFVSAHDDAAGYMRVASLTEKYQSLHLSETREFEEYSFTVQCSHQPCIEPREWVEVSIYRSVESGRLLLGKARSYVDRWKS